MLALLVGTAGLSTSCTDLDETRYAAINDMMSEIARDRIGKESILTRLSNALEEKDYRLASELQLLADHKIHALELAYAQYRRNIL